MSSMPAYGTPPGDMPHEEYESRINEIAYHLRRSFNALKKTKCTAYNPSSTRTNHAKSWNRGAHICLYYGYDPEVVVVAIFEAYERTPHSVFPTFVAGEGSVVGAMNARKASAARLRPETGEEDVSLYRSDEESWFEQIIFTSRLFLTSRNGHCEPNEETFEVLRSSMFPIPLLGRIHFGVTDPETMNRFQDDALKFLRGRPDLAKYLRKKDRKVDFPYKELKEWKKSK